MRNVIVFILFIAVLIGVVFAFMDCVKDSEPVSFEKYTVSSGDTLWEIAEKSNGYNKIDTREIVSDMKEASNISGTIYPGQVVLVPQY